MSIIFGGGCGTILYGINSLLRLLQFDKQLYKSHRDLHMPIIAVEHEIRLVDL